MRDRGSWTDAALAYLHGVSQVIEGLQEYWPLTLRQIYYQLVAAGVIENHLREYKKLSRTLAKARLDGMVTWEAMEDRARSMLQYGNWRDADTFIEDELSNFLTGYRRTVLQDQAHRLELWVEKDALSGVVSRAAVKYMVPVVVARGFSSISFIHQCRQRVEAAGVPTLILYFGDLDPSGWEMLPCMMETLQSEMDLGDQVQGIRCALTPEQVEEHGLPINPDALKPTDSRARKYMARFGDLAVELDALPPATLQELVNSAILDNVDVGRLAAQAELQGKETGKLETLKEKVQAFIDEEV